MALMFLSRGRLREIDRSGINYALSVRLARMREILLCDDRLPTAPRASAPRLASLLQSNSTMPPSTALEEHPTGILRHETMAKINALRISALKISHLAPPSNRAITFVTLELWCHFWLPGPRLGLPDLRMSVRISSPWFGPKRETCALPGITGTWRAILALEVTIDGVAISQPMHKNP
jgi:hypothetical protein